MKSLSFGHISPSLSQAILKAPAITYKPNIIYCRQCRFVSTYRMLRPVHMGFGPISPSPVPLDLTSITVAALPPPPLDYGESIVCQQQLGVLTYEGFSRMSSGKNAFIDLVKTKGAFTVPRMYQSVRSYRYCWITTTLKGCVVTGTLSHFIPTI